jgi:hypothetical protein
MSLRVPKPSLRNVSEQTFLPVPVPDARRQYDTSPLEESHARLA